LDTSQLNIYIIHLNPEFPNKQIIGDPATVYSVG